MGRRSLRRDAHRTDLLALFNCSSPLHGDFPQQAVARNISVFVTDFHDVSQAFPGVHDQAHLSVGRSIDRRALRGDKVQAVVLHFQLVDGIVLEPHRRRRLHIRHAP